MKQIVTLFIVILLSAKIIAQIPSGEVLWLRADKNVIADENGKVNLWKDFSPNGYNVNQSNPSSQPTLQKNVFGKEPAIFFDGIHGKYSLSNTVSNLMPSGSARTVFVVGRIDSNAVANGGGDFPSAGGTLFTFRRSTSVFSLQVAKITTQAASGYFVYTAGLGTNSNATVDRSVYHKSKVCDFVNTYISPGAYSFLKVRQNGEPVTVAQFNTIVYESGLTGFTVGDREDFSGQDWQGYIAEIIVYDRELNQDEILQTEKYLSNKYCCKKSQNSTTEITNSSKDLQIKLYPNPVKDNLQINGLPASKTRLTVIDYSGLIKTSKEINSTNYNWNISSLKPGNYILRIESNGTSTSIKFLKE